MATYDIIVIGAGIVGAACAHALADAGQRVLVLDARLGGATNAGMGHLVVMDDNPAELALSQASLTQWHAWAPRMAAEAPDTAFNTCGTLWVAQDAEEMQEAEHKRERLQAHGIGCDLLSAQQLATLEPVLRPGLHGALRVGGDSMVYAPNAAEWLLGHAAKPIHIEALRASRIEGRRVHCTDGSVREGGAVLLAAGIHATQFCPRAAHPPQKGPSGDYRPGQCSRALPARRAGLRQERPPERRHLGRLQPAAAPHGPVAAGVIAPIRYAGPGGGQRGAGAHAAPGH